jgi:hypothetical protein
MAPQYIFSAGMSIASARRRQAIMYVFFCFGLFCLSLNNVLAQNITPDAQQLFQQADTTTELNQKNAFSNLRCSFRRNTSRFVWNWPSR